MTLTGYASMTCAGKLEEKNITATNPTILKTKPFIFSSRYPFDTQSCKMVIPVVLLYRSSWETDSSYSDKVLECEGNSGEFVELVPQQLNYLGPKDLTQYFIRSYLEVFVEVW